MNELREIAERTMETARASGADDTIAEAIETSIRQIRFSNSEIDAFNSWNEKHVALFVAVGRRVMAADIRDIGQADKLARELVALAEKSPPSKNYRGIASGRFKYRKRGADRKIANLREPSRFVHDAIDGAESNGANNVGGTFFARHRRTAIASSGGPAGTDECAGAELSVRAFSQPEASGHSVSCTPRLVRMNARRTGERAGALAKMAENPVLGEQGKFDIIMEPLCLGGLVHSTSHMMSALMVEIATSMYAKKIGKRVASDEVTFADDPTIDSISARAFDHEGVPTRRNIIIRKGILKTYLHNTSTAKRFRTRTTASAGPLIPTSSAITAQPIPMHPVLVPGKWDAEEIIADTNHGLYLNNVWYTRYQNYATGEFSTIPRDAILSIEDGEIVRAVKNVRISDNMMNFWKSIDALSKSTQEVYWWDESAPPSTLPMIRSRAMNITRSS